jgi:hypothetical protein
MEFNTIAVSDGVSMGSEAIHPWPSGVFTNAVDGITTNAWYNNSAQHVYTAFTSLTGWQNLRPDLGNSLVTAGRGTRGGAGGVSVSWPSCVPHLAGEWVSGYARG